MPSSRQQFGFQVGLAAIATVTATAIVLSGVEKIRDASDRMH